MEEGKEAIRLPPTVFLCKGQHGGGDAIPLGWEASQDTLMITGAEEAKDIPDMGRSTDRPKSRLEAKEASQEDALVITGAGSQKAFRQGEEHRQGPNQDLEAKASPGNVGLEGREHIIELREVLRQ